jgi:uncharacterized protein YdeI (YjbR/CyaY-like superfamily)
MKLHIEITHTLWHNTNPKNQKQKVIKINCDKLQTIQAQNLTGDKLTPQLIEAASHGKKVVMERKVMFCEEIEKIIFPVNLTSRWKTKNCL